MEYFKTFTQKDIEDLIISTKKSLYLCIPSVHAEICGALGYLDYTRSFENVEVEIKLLIDFDAQTFRQGYGDFREVHNLIEGGFDVKYLKDNRISFIISDDIGYYLFIESRSLIPADKETINAVSIDPVSLVRLKQFFFSGDPDFDIENELANAIIEESMRLKDASNLLPKQNAQVKEIGDKEIIAIEIDLKKNPPIHPDFKRIVEFYTTKFQYAELHFEGQNFKHYSVKIPSKLLPYKNKELREKLVTKMKLFENISETESFTSFDEISKNKKKISETYLTPLKCRRGRSLLRKNDKINFKNEVAELANLLDTKKNDLYHSMLDEIKKAENQLQITLYQFFLANPTEEMENMGKANYTIMAENISKGLMKKLDIPDPSKWISSFKLETNYSDITAEDLSDQILLQELLEKELIDYADSDRLAVFGEGISFTT